MVSASILTPPCCPLSCSLYLAGLAGKERELERPSATHLLSCKLSVIHETVPKQQGDFKGTAMDIIAVSCDSDPSPAAIPLLCYSVPRQGNAAIMRGPKSNDKQVLDSLLESYPGFLRDGLSWHPGPDPPDFIATSASGERLGLEMTEWLHKTQTGVSISNQKSRIHLLKLLGSEHRERPNPLTRVIITDRLDVPFRAGDHRAYVDEVYQLVEEHAVQWEQQQALGIYRVQNFARYRTLAKYCISIGLYGPPRFCDDPNVDWCAPGIPWIAFEPMGALYDPQWAVDALIECIRAKTLKYRDFHRVHSLDEFVLLVHYGIRGIVHNTPFRGRNAKLHDAEVQAHEWLLNEHSEFDSVYLYMNFNGGKLVQLFPEQRTMLEFAHQPEVQ